MSLLDELPIITDEELARMTPEQIADVDLMYELAFAEAAREDESNWEHWLRWLFPEYFTAAFAEHHARFWEWAWSIELGEKPDEAFVAIWPRGGAKSSSAEAAAVAFGARRKRRYGLYICETQAQADDHVQNVAAMLESKQLGVAYPELGQRLVGKFGSSKGWRRNRLRTAGGFTLDALGLDSAARGLKLDDDRPDLFIFDDLDNEDDGPGQVQHKVDSITKKILPAGDEAPAVLMIQNLIHPQGVFARLAGVAEIPADFLTNRIVSGPIPALVDPTFEAQPDGSWKIIDGEPTWEGQDRARCQQNVDDWGITAFKTEALHDTDAIGGGMFDHVIFQHCHRDAVPDLTRVVVWVDPAVTATDKSDSMAIQVDGLGGSTIYRLRSWERRASPVDALGLAIAWAMLEGALRVGVETDQGGDTWQSVFKEAHTQVLANIATVRDGGELAKARIPEYVTAIVQLSGRDPDTIRQTAPHFAEEKAGSTQMPKAHRVQQMLPDYEKAGRIVHVIGTHLILERALFRFPRTKPFDLTDAAYYGWNDLHLYGRPVRTSSKANRRKMQMPALAHH